MNRHLNFVTLICLITGFVSLASCSNDDDEMNKYQKIYIRTGVAPGAEMSAVVVVDRVSNSSTADRSDFEIQLCAVQPVSREVTATLGIDTLKVNAYNSLSHCFFILIVYFFFFFSLANIRIACSILPPSFSVICVTSSFSVSSVV